MVTKGSVKGLADRKAIVFIAIIILFIGAVRAYALDSLPMDSTATAPPPLDEGYLSDNEYRDDSIHVVISEGEYNTVHYFCARVTINHASQLRTVPARQVRQADAVFSAWDKNEARAGAMAKAVNAVVAINGDYYTAEKCHVVMRQCTQVRNIASGLFDVLVIDKNGDFDAVYNCTREDYAAYYEAHHDQMYQAFCFGPVLVLNGECVIDDSFRNGYMIADKLTQRVAICQIGPLDYMIIVCDGDAMFYTFGLTIKDFAELCASVGKSVSPEGFRMAYNLDGGNSATLVFKRKNEQGELVYSKLNMPERERDLADLICFVSLGE